MRTFRLGLAACLLAWSLTALAAEPPPAGRVERVPPQQALAILGTQVTGPDGKTIGRLVDVLVNAAGMPEAGVIDVGGFMGVGTRKIAVHWSTLHFAPGNPKQPITLDLTLNQIKSAPEYGSPNKPAPVVLPAHRSAPSSTTTSTTTISKTTTSTTTASPAPGKTTPASGATGPVPSPLPAPTPAPTPPSPPVPTPAPIPAPNVAPTTVHTTPAATPAASSAPGQPAPPRSE